MKPALLTDVDGVLLDWVAGFRQYQQVAGYKFNSQHPVNFELEGWINGIEGDRLRELIHKFNHSDYFSMLSPTTGAGKFIEAVKEDFELIAITACGRDIAHQRVRNLETIFGEKVFSSIHCLDLGESKSKVLSLYRRTVWVEDSLHGAQQGHEAGHDVFLLDRPWNKGTGSFIRVRSLAELEQLI